MHLPLGQADRLPKHVVAVLAGNGAPGPQYSAAPGSQKVCDSGILLLLLLIFSGQQRLFATLVCIRAYGCLMPTNNTYVIKLPADVQAKLP